MTQTRTQNENVSAAERSSRKKKRARVLAAVWTLSGIVLAMLSPLAWLWAMRQLGATELEYTLKNYVALWVLWGTGYTLLVTAMTESHNTHMRQTAARMRDTAAVIRESVMELLLKKLDIRKNG